MWKIVGGGYGRDFWDGVIGCVFERVGVVKSSKCNCTKILRYFEKFYPMRISKIPITKKNLILDSNKLYLIDWEPCLKQIRRGYSTLLYTEPYRSLNDIKNNILSYETDKIAFFFSCLYILYRRRPLGVLREIVLARKKQAICITPIHESTFVLLNFQELVNLAIENKNWKLN